MGFSTKMLSVKLIINNNSKNIPLINITKLLNVPKKYLTHNFPNKIHD